MDSESTLGHTMTSSPFHTSSLNDSNDCYSSKNAYLEVPCEDTGELSPFTPTSPASELESEYSSDQSIAGDEYDQEDITDELNGYWFLPTSTEPAADEQDEYIYQVGDDDEFPLIHEFTTAWNFTPASAPPIQLPSIRFTPSGGPSNNLHSYVPLQDFNFGRQLTILDHHAVNVVHPPMSLDAFASGQDDFLSPPSSSTSTSTSPFRSSSSLPLPASASSTPGYRVNPYSRTGVTVQDALAHLWQVIPADWSSGCWAWEQGRWRAVVDQIADEQSNEHMSPCLSDETSVEYIPSHNKHLRTHWERKRALLATEMNGRIVSSELPRSYAGVEVLETIDEERPFELRQEQATAKALMHSSPPPDLVTDLPLPTHTDSGKPIEIYDPDAEEDLPDLSGW